MTTYLIDDNFEIESTSSLAKANKVAERMKKENPLRTVYISIADDTGLEGDKVIAELQPTPSGLPLATPSLEYHHHSGGNTTR